MSIQELYLIVVALATLLPALLIGPVLRHRHKPGATGLLILIVGSITMSFGVGMNTVAPTPRYWIYFANLMILGASLSATGYFLLVADYTNHPF